MTIDPDEAPEYFFRYIELVETDDVCAALVQQQSSFLDGLRRVTDETASHRYDHDKWSIRQILAHLNDCERLFLFRAFWFARGFESPLPGFDQNIAAAHDGSERRALVAALLEGNADARSAVRTKGRRVTSALTLAETARAILRARVAGRLTAEQERAAVQALRRFERRCYVVAVTDGVLARVRRPFPVEPIRTLDAVHLATAELLGEPPPLMTIVTRDDRVRENAKALGYAVA
jgi:predicted nucleic acid-binding protein